MRSDTCRRNRVGLFVTILLDSTTRVLVHGTSGPIGGYQLDGMRRYGTRIVAVISRSPLSLDWAPTYVSIRDAQADVRGDLLVTYASGRYVGAVAAEAFEAGVRTVVAVAEDVPMRDVIATRQIATAKGARLIGPNTNGILSPGAARVGFFSPEFGMPGSVGVISRSGTLGYGALVELGRIGVGQSTVVGIGGGIARGTSAAEVFRLFESDVATRAVVFLGETGSREEEELAAALRQSASKPLFVLLAGVDGGGEDGMGHAGAVIFDGTGTIDSKRKILQASGAIVVRHLGELNDALKEFRSVSTEVKG